jgi:hypothetical protein
LYDGKIRPTGVANDADLKFAIAKATEYFKNCISRDAVCFYLQLLLFLLSVSVLVDGWPTKAF